MRSWEKPICVHTNFHFSFLLSTQFQFYNFRFFNTESVKYCKASLAFIKIYFKRENCSSWTFNMARIENTSGELYQSCFATVSNTFFAPFYLISLIFISLWFIRHFFYFLTTLGLFLFHFATLYNTIFTDTDSLFVFSLAFSFPFPQLFQNFTVFFVV